MSMFSPKRSSDRKVDKKAMRDRFRRLSQDRSKDNNIKLNILGVPKEQVSVKKAHKESKNEDVFKIYIDTEDKRANSRRNTSNSSDDSTSAIGTSTPQKRGRRDNDVCLNLPGGKAREVRIIRHPSEAVNRDSPNQQNTQYNVLPEIKQNKINQQRKEPTHVRHIDHEQLSSPESENKLEIARNVRQDKPVKRKVEKHGSRQVGFAEYDAVYGTGSEESSDDNLPFDKKSPMVYRVGGDTPGGAFEHSGLKNSTDPNTASLSKKGNNQPLDPNNTELEPSMGLADQEGRPNQFVPATKSDQLNSLKYVNNDGISREQPSKKNSFDNSSRNVIGIPHNETLAKNNSKPITVDRESMTDNHVTIDKGNLLNVGSSLSKKLPVSRNPSEESTGRYRNPDHSKTRKPLVTSIPKPDFSAFRRQNSPTSSAGNEKGPDLTEKTSNGIRKDDIDGAKNQTVDNVTNKPHRKLTPVNVSHRNYKPIFFPSNTNDLEDQNEPSQQHPERLSDGQLRRKSNEVDILKNQIPIDSDKRKTYGKTQTTDDMRSPPSEPNGEGPRSMSNVLNGSKVNDLAPVRRSVNQEDNGSNSPVLDGYADLTDPSSSYGVRVREHPTNGKGSRSMSIVLNGSKVNELAPVKRSFNQEDNGSNPHVLDGYADLTDKSPSYGVPAREHNNSAVPVDEHIDKDTVNRRFASPSQSSQIFNPSQQLLDPSGTRSDGSNEVRDSEGFMKYGDSVGSSVEIASSTYPSRVVSVDMRSKQPSTFAMDDTPSPVIQQLANLLMDGTLSPQDPSSATIKPVPTTSLQDLNELPNEGVNKPHIGTKESAGLMSVSGLNPNDYSSTGAIPRTTRAVKSSQGSKSGLAWPSVGEKLSKRGSPSIDTIKEEGTDEMDTSLSGPPGPSNKNDWTSNGSKLTLDISGAKYAPGEGNNNIDNDHKNILAYIGNLADGTPFAYTPSGPDARPLENTRSGDTSQSEHRPVDEPQLQKSTKNRGDSTGGRPGRKTKTLKQRPVSGRVRKRSGVPRSDGIEKGVFGQSPEQKIVYLGKIPNTTYNVFYSPDQERKAAENTESTTTVVNPVRKNMVWDLPKGILIFVNKKNDHACPFKNGNRNVSAYPVESNRDDYRNGGSREAVPRPRRPSMDKKVTVERTSRGKTVKEEYPCGCYRITTFDTEGVLQNEAFVSALCGEGSLCEVAHPELAPPSPEGSRALSAYRPKEAGRASRRPSYEAERLPGIEVIAEGAVSRNAIKPKPPSPTMKGADLFASVNVKSDRLNGVFNFYLDPRLKRYLRDNLPAMLEEGETGRRRDSN